MSTGILKFIIFDTKY